MRELADLLMGTSPPGDTYNEVGNGLPLINGPAEYGPRHPIPVKWTTAATRICQAGDTLICVRGNTTGKLNRADREYCIGRGVAAVTAKPTVCDPSFLWWNLEQLAPRILDAATGAGTTFPNINKPQLAALPIPNLPLLDQQAIAAVLDAVDAAIEQTRAAIDKARRLKQAVVQRFFDCLEAKSNRLAEFVTDICYGTSQASNDRCSGYPTLRIPNVIGGTIDTSDLTYVTAPPKDVHRYTLREGDLLMVRTNGNPRYIGRSAVFAAPDNQKWLYASYLIRLRFDERLRPRFVDEWLKAERGRRELLRRVTTSAGNHNINTKNIASLPVPIPADIQKQDEFVRLATASNRLLNTLDVELEKTQRLKRGLLQVLLTRKVRVVV